MVCSDSVCSVAHCLHDLFDAEVAEQNIFLAPQGKLCAGAPVFCCDDEFTEPCNTGSVTRRAGWNMKVTLLSPQKGTFCSVFPLFSTASHAAVCRFQQNQTTKRNHSGGGVCVWQSTDEIDREVRQLIYPFFNSGFNSTKIIQFT